MRKVKWLVAVLAALPACALAQETPEAPTPVPTAGNLPPGFYPKSPCIKPDMQGAYKPRDVRDIRAINAYNDKIKAYNQTAAAFNTCVTAYADKAKHDIAEIQAAIRDANAR